MGITYEIWWNFPYSTVLGAVSGYLSKNVMLMETLNGTKHKWQLKDLIKVIGLIIMMHFVQLEITNQFEMCYCIESKT